MGILQDTYEHRLSSLTVTERTVFNWLDSHPEVLLLNTLTQIARQSSSSNSVIIRLSQKLGFSGFSEFKYSSRHLLSKSEKITKSLLDELHNFSVDDNSVRFFSNEIFKANKIYTAAIGTTKPIAEYFSKHLFQLNKDSAYIYERPMLDLMPNFAASNDICIFLSVSGETVDLVHSAQKTTLAGFKTFSITSTRRNSLRRACQWSMYPDTDMEMLYFNNYDISPRVQLQALVDLIFEDYHQRYISKKH
ncbi:MurR/RpiR family transcriptional regulator [Lactovum odontotermitis]